MLEGQRFQEWSKNEDQKRWEPWARSGAGRDLPFTFFVSEAAVMVEGKILVGFNGLFRRGKVTGT